MQPKIHTFEMYVLGGFGLIGVNWQIVFFTEISCFLRRLRNCSSSSLLSHRGTLLTGDGSDDDVTEY
jgi:hypothetical protein